MKKILLPIAALAFLSSRAQSTKAFALTDANKGGVQWNQIQVIDLSNGSITSTLMDGRKTTAHFKYDNPSKGLGTQTTSNLQIMPMGQSSAALAFDEQNNRIYFSPMFQLGEIRYMNLDEATPYVHVVKFTQKVNNSVDREADNFTRMVIGSDGDGYAITNDANTFIHFSTGKNASVENLGALIDDKKNIVSIHDRGTSWGGDIVADAFGKFYLFTVGNNVFKINPATRLATYLGVIKGLPVGFTTNAAAVNSEGKIIIGSAISAGAYFTLDLDNLTASTLPGSNVAFNVSDLATSNLYDQDKYNRSLQRWNLPTTITADQTVNIYPNPVTNGTARVVFSNIKNGNYTLTLTNQAGQYITQKQTTVFSKGQTQDLGIDTKLAKGTYYIKVNDVDKKQVTTTSFVVE